MGRGWAIIPNEFRLQILELFSLDKKRPSYGLHTLMHSQKENTQMWFILFQREKTEPELEEGAWVEKL